MAKLHYLTALLLIVLLAIASGWFFDSIDKNPIKTKEKPRHAPDYFLKNFTATTMDDKGKPAYKIKAGYLEHFPDDNSMELQQPFFTFYEKNVINWTAQSNNAVVLQADERINLNGAVVLNQISRYKNTRPMSLTAEQLTIEPKKNLAHTKLKIQLKKENSSIQAIGMRADMNKNKIKFLTKTKSHFSWSTKTEKHTVNIKANSLLLDEKKGISEYKGKVLFTKGSLIIKANAITLFYKNNKLIKAMISGFPADVKHKPDNEAKMHSQANNMEFFVEEERLVLQGDAFVKQGNRHFSGEIIEYDTQQRSITAAGNQDTIKNSKNTPPKGRVHVIIGPNEDDENSDNTDEEDEE